MRRRELDRYLIELMGQRTWVEGMKLMLADAYAPGKPWPCFRGEHAVWL
jgi:hypothetical protein